ncbi:MAG: hypothetical protein RMK79_07080, partial [Anaerolineae bacterium]|nr:hypothetical protein [Anaerolineae bacterium]
MMKKALARHILSLPTISLFLIIGIGAGLRVWGLNFGLPYVYHVDEQVYVSAALNLGRGVIAQHAVSTFQNILFVEYILFYLIGHFIGWFSSLADFEALYRGDSTPFFLL